MFNNKLVFQIEGIIDSDNGEIGSTAALNTTDKLDKNMKKMSKQDAQNLLERLEAQKWIKIVCFKGDDLYFNCLNTCLSCIGIIDFITGMLT